MSDVNMLTSLKALLFSSAAMQIPADGAAASAAPGGEAADFAALLNGTMAAAPEGQDAVAFANLPQMDDPAVTDEAADTGIVPAVVDGADVESEEFAARSALPFGLANALKAVQDHRKDSLPLPPGLARKVETSTQPAAEDSAPAPDAEPVQMADTETFLPLPIAVDGIEPDLTEPPVSMNGEQLEIVRPVAQPKPDKFVSLPDVPRAEQADEPTKGAQDDGGKPKEQVDAAPLPPSLVAAAHIPQPLPPPAAAVPSPKREAAPAELDTGKNLPLEAPLLPQAAKPKLTGPEPVARPESAIVEAFPDDVWATVDLPAPAAENRAVKSEALALLQLVRDQIAARQPDTPVRAGEPLATRIKAARTVLPADSSPTDIAQPMVRDAVHPMPLAQPVASSPTQPVVAAPPVADLSASLGAQVVDMGVSGQWIDGLARDIAGLSTNGAQGRFQIDADRLGTVQVDIRQGHEGASVSLTVASEAAELALRQDSDRLRLDAGLSAVRIAEVKVERAPHVAEAARADGSGQQGSQPSSQQGSQGPGGWTNNSHNMAQSQGQAQGQGRGRPQENGAFAAKNSGDPAVLNHDDARRGGNEALRARYA